MITLTMTQKLILGGVGTLAVGLGAGYLVGTNPDASDGTSAFGRGAMMRDRADFVPAAGYDRDDRRGGYGTSVPPRDTPEAVPGRQAVSVPGNRGDVGRENCIADECLLVDGLEYPVGTLSQEVKSAVLFAIDDEYKARATYEAVMAKFGRVRPFVMIARAETQHISSLSAVLEKYGENIPADPWIGKVSAPETLTDACRTGVEAEIANAALYRDSLLPTVSEYADISAVFTMLMDASQNQHLPAFQNCD